MELRIKNSDRVGQFVFIHFAPRPFPMSLSRLSFRSCLSTTRIMSRLTSGHSDSMLEMANGSTFSGSGDSLEAVGGFAGFNEGHLLERPKDLGCLLSEKTLFPFELADSLQRRHIFG